MNKRRKILLSTALAVTLGLTGCGNKEDKLRYQYNSETNTEELVGTTDSLDNLKVVKINDFNNQSRYYVTKQSIGWEADRWCLVGTKKKIQTGLNDHPYGDIIYAVDLEDLAYYYDNSILKENYTAEEINEMIEKLKIDEEKVLNNDKVYKLIKP